MLRPRIIPCLLVKDKGLVKTINFGSPKYVGDPINAVRIFNEKQVDELMVLDIDATINSHEPDLKMIEFLATECRMPLCYGGGIKTKEQAMTIFSLGVEKIAISSAAVEDPSLIGKISSQVGSQSVVVVIDVKKIKPGKYEVFTYNGKKATSKDPELFAQEAQRLGAGEIVINSIDRDGTMTGYDMDLVERVRNSTSLPMTVLGGAGSHEDIGLLIKKFGIIGAAAGSLFVFKGIYRAVLINYPDIHLKDKLVNENLI